MARSNVGLGQPDPAILGCFDRPDEVRVFEKGRYEVVHIAGQSLGRATYEPGWRWSEHVGKRLGQRLCPHEHLGYVLSGTATAAFEDGRIIELTAGHLFYISAIPHDSWVVGDTPYVALHLLSVQQYAKS